MSLNANFNYKQNIQNMNVTNSITSGSAKINNEIITISTIGTLMNTISLSVIGNSNTIGNIFTTGGSVGIGTTSPSSLLTVNGGVLVNNILGGYSTQYPNDTIILGNGSQSNFFLDRNVSGAFIFGYNTPKINTIQSPFQVYNNSTDRVLLLSCVSAGINSGSSSIYVGTGFSNIPAFCYNTAQSSGSLFTINQYGTLLTGGNVIIDNKSGFNSNTGQYIIPITGYYQVSYFVRGADGTAAYFIALGASGSVNSNYITLGCDVSNRKCGSYSNIFYYTAGTPICIFNNSYQSNFFYSKFSVYLVTLY